MVTALQRSGAVVIDSVLPEVVSRGLCVDLRPEFDREGHLYQNNFNGHKTLRVGGVTKYSPHFPTLLLHPTVLAIADAILKPHCEVYQVGSTTAIEILPGEQAQVLHADDTCYPSDLLPFEAQISVLSSRVCSLSFVLTSRYRWLIRAHIKLGKTDWSNALIVRCRALHAQ